MKQAYGLIRLMFRPTNPFRNDPASQIAKDRQTYIPPNIGNVPAPAAAYTPARPATSEGPNSATETLPATPAPDAGPADTSPDNAYSFITADSPEVKQPLWQRIPGGNSWPVRILYAGIGLLILLILFSVIRGALGGSGKLNSFVTIVQEQQELIHLVSEASNNQNLPASTQNFVATAQLSLNSSQSSTISYLTQNHQKLKPKTLNLRISHSTDKQLTAATAAGTYDQTFRDVMQSELKSYSSTLARTYQTYTGKKGRELLKDCYRQAQLLQIQLATAPAS